MEKKVKEEDGMSLPPGFRFHPTDEELISHYLYKKVINSNFSCRAIGQVDMNKSEPWDLPRKAKMGEKEWYFFCLRDRKYPTGLRINRATESGYWKATGKDKEIFREKYLIGMKKTLVFYTGRAPKGEKSNWVIHEYRLDGKFSVLNPSETSENEWVICRVFQKHCSSGKKVIFSGLEKLDSSGSALPPLEDSPTLFSESEPGSVSSCVPCFSNRNSQRNQQKLVGLSEDESIFLENLQFEGQSIVTEKTQKSGLILNRIWKRVSGEMRFSEDANKNQMFKTEEEKLNFSHETEEMGDANTMICWAMADHERTSRPFDYKAGPSSFAPDVGPVSFWNF